MLLINKATGDLQALDVADHSACCLRAMFTILMRVGYEPSDANAIAFHESIVLGHRSPLLRKVQS